MIKKNCLIVVNFNNNKTHKISFEFITRFKSLIRVDDHLSLERVDIYCERN